MASQSQGIQQLLQAEKRAAEKVAEARKREYGEAARDRDRDRFTHSHYKTTSKPPRTGRDRDCNVIQTHEQ